MKSKKDYYHHIPLNHSDVSFCKNCGEEIVWEEKDGKWSAINNFDKKKHYCEY